MKNDINKTRWSKPFDPQKKLVEYFGEDEKYKSIIDSMYIHFLHKNSPAHKNKYRVLTLEKIYIDIKHTVLGYMEVVLPIMRANNFTQDIDWEKYDSYHIDVDLGELTGTSGWNGNFYDEPNYYPYYKLLMLLTEEGYDVRAQWREFREDFSFVWKELPDFHRGLGKNSEYYQDPPEGYDPDKPFPQFPIPNDID